jgi:type VI protein secretion system component Hcp
MLAIRKSGGSNLLYVQFMFREVAVTGITWGGGAGDSPPIETVTFEFEAMGFQYVQQKTDGTPGRRLLWSWNTKANKAGLNVKGLEPAPDFLSPTQA